MARYPYDFSKTFIIRKTGVPEHYKRVRSQILAKAPYANDVSRNDLNALAQAVYWIDHAASVAADDLKRSPWSKKQLQTLAPPTKSKRHLSEWVHFRDRQTCITQCEIAREAILQGRWGTAIESALNAGRLIGHSKRANRQQIGMRTTHPTSIRAQQNKAIILNRAAYYQSRRKWTLNYMAKRIADEHPNERGFSYELIRKLLRADRTWGNQI
jgi:hypothetical protein